MEPAVAEPVESAVAEPVPAVAEPEESAVTEPVDPAVTDAVVSVDFVVPAPEEVSVLVTEVSLVVLAVTLPLALAVTLPLVDAPDAVVQLKLVVEVNQNGVAVGFSCLHRK